MTKRKSATNALKGSGDQKKQKVEDEQQAKATALAAVIASIDDHFTGDGIGPSGAVMSTLGPPATTTVPKLQTATLKQQRIKLKGPAPPQTTIQPTEPRPARKAVFLTRQPPIKQMVVTCRMCHTRPTFAPVTTQFGTCYECRRSVEREMEAMFDVQERRDLVAQQAERAEKRNEVIVIDD